MGSYLYPVANLIFDIKITQPIELKISFFRGSDAT